MLHARKEPSGKTSFTVTAVDGTVSTEGASYPAGSARDDDYPVNWLFIGDVARSYMVTGAVTMVARMQLADHRQFAERVAAELSSLGWTVVESSQSPLFPVQNIRVTAEWDIFDGPNWEIFIRR